MYVGLLHIEYIMSCFSHAIIAWYVTVDIYEKEYILFDKGWQFVFD